MATSPAVFFFAHPDDEVLAAGVAIVEHVTAGQDVHVAILTQGEASGALAILNGDPTVGISSWWGVLHDPAAEDYAPLDRAELAYARAQEAQQSCRSLSVGLAGTLTVHQGTLPDGGVTVADAQGMILAICDSITTGPVRIKGHTYEPKLDAHPDHVAVGQALRNLSAIDPARFGDRRHYILPGYWTDPDLHLVSWAWDMPTNADVAARARNAGRCYGAWAPVAVSYAVGWHSRADWFQTQDVAPRCMVHT